MVVRCYAPKGKGEQGRFALDVALRTLPFYNHYLYETAQRGERPFTHDVAAAARRIRCPSAT